MANKQSLPTPIGKTTTPYSAIFKADFGTEKHPIKKGVFKAEIEFNKEEFDKPVFKRLKDVLDEEVKKLEPKLAEIKKKLYAKGKKQEGDSLFINNPIKERYDEEGNATGIVVMRAKTHAIVDTKKGEWKKEQVPAFDSSGSEITQAIALGKGSELQMNVSWSPYANEAAGVGLTLYLNSVMIHNPVSNNYSSSQTADDFGFDVSGGGYTFSQDDVINIQSHTEKTETTTEEKDDDDF